MAGIKFNVREGVASTRQQGTTQSWNRLGQRATIAHIPRSGSPLLKLLVPLWLLALVCLWAVVTFSKPSGTLAVGDSELIGAYRVYYQQCISPGQPATSHVPAAACPTPPLPLPEALARDLDRIAILRNQGENDLALEAARQMLSRLGHDERNPVVLNLRNLYK